MNGSSQPCGLNRWYWFKDFFMTRELFATYYMKPWVWNVLLWVGCFAKGFSSLGGIVRYLGIYITPMRKDSGKTTTDPGRGGILYWERQINMKYGCKKCFRFLYPYTRDIKLHRCVRPHGGKIHVYRSVKTTFKSPGSTVNVSVCFAWTWLLSSPGAKAMSYLENITAAAKRISISPRFFPTHVWIPNVLSVGITTSGLGSFEWNCETDLRWMGSRLGDLWSDGVAWSSAREWIRLAVQNMIPLRVQKD